jgi:Na+-driven multidrug efflux pump
LPELNSRHRVITHRSVLAIAAPIMVSNLSTPLLGVVDTGVIGQIPDASLIGAVALGALVFSFVQTMRTMCAPVSGGHS